MIEGRTETSAELKLAWACSVALSRDPAYAANPSSVASILMLVASWGFEEVVAGDRTAREGWVFARALYSDWSCHND